MKRVLALMLGLFVLAGCGSSPEPDFHTLGAAPGDVTPGAYTIRVERPSLPPYLDRPDFARQVSDDQMVFDDMKNWAAPLDRMFGRILAEDLRQRLPASTILTGDDGISLEARFTVETDIGRFNAVEDGVALGGQFLVKDRQAARQHAAEPVQAAESAGASASATVAGLNILIGRLADRIVARIAEDAAQNPPPAPQNARPAVPY